VSRVFLAWFPSPAFAKVFVAAVLVAVLSDEVIRRLGGGRGGSWRQGRDRASFLLVQLAALIAFFFAVHLPYQGIAVVPSCIQVLALGLLILGTLLREWAVFLLGRFCSRTVEVERDHRLVTDGP
jgi:protein-S-isoprenylcysteine O-methyltransferase Ste14